VARQPSGIGRARKNAGRAEPVSQPAAEDVSDLQADDRIEVQEDFESSDPAGEDADDELDAEDLDEDFAAEDDEAEDDDAEDDDAENSVRSAQTDALWAEVRVDPVEIALPRGVGYTLRAYRPSTELAEPDVGDRDDEFPGPAVAGRDQDEIPEIDEEELARLALAAGRERRSATRRRVDEPDEDGEHELPDGEADEELLDSGEDEGEEAEPEGDEVEPEAVDEEDDEEGEEDEPEEVPAFLSHRGRLLLFRSADGLVEYVRSDAPHDLVQLDTWEQLRNRVRVEDIVPNEADSYELDLVVENLRGGPDAWDAGLLIQAGEVTRDIGYALRIEPVITALSPGSPLDDLDDALRAAEGGGIGGFFARRKVRKIRSETAALGWRTIIGKISALVDWRD
jgi:hypothetical protein